MDLINDLLSGSATNILPEPRTVDPLSEADQLTRALSPIAVRESDIGSLERSSTTRSLTDRAVERTQQPIEVEEDLLATPSSLNIDRVFVDPALSIIGNLTTREVRGLLAQLAKAATDFSTDRYSFYDSGSAGKYAMDIRFLEVSGALKPGTYDKLLEGTRTADSLLSNPGNWDGRATNPKDLDEFLENEVIQEKTMILGLRAEYNRLIANGGILTTDTKEAVAGMISIAYRISADEALKWRRGAPLDGDKQSLADKMYDLGKYSINLEARR